MKTAEKICGLLIFVSLILKLALITGGSILFVLSILVLSLIYYPFGFAFFNQVILRRIFKKESYKGISVLRIIGAIGVGMALSAICIGTLFKIQEWPGANTNLKAGLISSILILIISIYKYLKFKALYYKRILIRLIIIGVFGLILLYTSNLNLVKIQFRNHPQYIRAYELYLNDPKDKALIKNLDIEYARATMPDEGFKLYQKYLEKQ